MFCSSPIFIISYLLILYNFSVQAGNKSRKNGDNELDFKDEFYASVSGKIKIFFCFIPEEI